MILDDNLAPDGYSYFFVTNHQATLAVCMFRDYTNNRDYLEKTYRAFSKYVNFEPKDKELFGGTSNVFLMRKATFNKRLYVGESAGFIDGMWGFGMKFALMSGYLSAQSIINNESYEKSWKRELYPQVKASLVNRWYYKMFGKRSYEFIVKRMKKSQDPLAFLNKLSTYSLIHKIGLPFALLFSKGKFKDRRNFK